MDYDYKDINQSYHVIGDHVLMKTISRGKLDQTFNAPYIIVDANHPKK